MRLEHLFVQDYRNLIQGGFGLFPEAELFGHNGMWVRQTCLTLSILLSVAAPSMPSDMQTVRHGAECFQIQGTYAMPSGDLSVIGCLYRPAGTQTVQTRPERIQPFFGPYRICSHRYAFTAGFGIDIGRQR